MGCSIYLEDLEAHIRKKYILTHSPIFLGVVLMNPIVHISRKKNLTIHLWNWHEDGMCYLSSIFHFGNGDDITKCWSRHQWNNRSIYESFYEWRNSSRRTNSRRLTIRRLLVSYLRHPIFEGNLNERVLTLQISKAGDSPLHTV